MIVDVGHTSSKFLSGHILRGVKRSGIHRIVYKITMAVYGAQTKVWSDD